MTGKDFAMVETVIPIAPEEQAREEALREQFARYWASATGELRTIYDTFIAASEPADGIATEAVEKPDVHGWWVRPRRAASDRAILYLHGGGYQLGSAQAYRNFVSQLVGRTDVPALAIDYPLAPEAKLPAAPNAALVAWRWLVAQGYRHIAIAGDSAGGGLALVTLATLARAPDVVRPAAGVVFSPWTDLALTGASLTDPAVNDPLIAYDYIQDCVRKVLGDADPRDPFASPLYGDLKGLPPILVQVGTDERLLDDSRLYAERAAQAGIPVQLEIWQGMHHVFQLDGAHLESSRHALDRAARFLRTALGISPA